MNIAVVGAGPAGLAAACCAAEALNAGMSAVTLIDDNPMPGGQIWRNSPGTWLHRLQAARVNVVSGARVIAADRQQLLIESAAGVSTLAFDKLILTTGSRELFLPFPGWTLPGVMGVGGLQAMVKSGLPVQGKRIAVAGTGPLLLAAAAHLAKHGARIVSVAEQTPWSKLFAFGARLPLSKAREGLGLWHAAYAPGSWVAAAQGREALESITIQTASRSRTVACDYLGAGYGFVPNDELLQALGCGTGPPNAYQQTVHQEIYAAGEITGIGGVDLSLAEGAIAGYAAAGSPDRAHAFFRQREKWRAFSLRLARAFALRDELKSLARPEDFICRCEDVSLARLQSFRSWREAKLQTRCGMGPCQGRICGPITAHLFGWTPGSVRPPIFPAPVSSFILDEMKT